MTETQEKIVKFIKESDVNKNIYARDIADHLGLTHKETCAILHSDPKTNPISFRSGQYFIA